MSTGPSREVITSVGRRVELDRGSTPVTPTVDSGGEHLITFNIHDERISPANYDKADGAPLRVLHSDPARFDVSKRSVEDMGFWHRSLDDTEVIICVEGALRWETELGTRVLRPGDVLVIPRGIAHRSALCDDSEQQNILVEVKVKGDLDYVGPGLT